MRCVCGVLPVYAAKILLDLCGSCKQQVHVHATKKEVLRKTDFLLHQFHIRNSTDTNLNNWFSPVSWRQRRTKLHRENLSQVCDPWHGRQRQGMSSYPIPLSEPPGRWCTLCTHTWPGPQGSTCPRRIFVPSDRGPPPLQLPLPLPARLAAPDRQCPA